MSEKKTDLTEYITRNEKVVTGLGIFVAIASFVGEAVKDPKAANYIVCIFTILILILLRELYQKFPKEREPAVEIFFVFLCFGIGALLYNAVVNALLFVFSLLGGALLGLVIGGIFWVYKKIRK